MAWGWDSYDNAMGGGLLGNLTEEEKRRLRMQSMGAMGAGLLDVSGWSQTPQTLGQGMAQGMANAQGVYQQGAAQLSDYKDRQVQRDAALAKQQQETEARAELDRIVASGEQLSPQQAMKIVTLAPSTSNIVQQILKNQQAEKPKEALPLSAIGKQVYDMGVRPGTPEWQQAYSQALAASRAPRGGGGSEATTKQRDYEFLIETGATPAEAMQLAFGGRGKDAKGGRALPVSVVEKMGKAGANAETFGRLASTFKPEYTGGVMGMPVGGSAINAVGRIMGDDTGRTQWWQDYQAQANAIRNDLFGAALTAQEKAEFDKAMINPNMDDEEIAKNLTRQHELAMKGVSRIADPYRRMGYDPEAIDAAVGLPGQAQAEAPDLTPPAVGDVQEEGGKRYRFKGGDPSDPANWEQIP